MPARLHHALAQRRRQAVLAVGDCGPALAKAIWALELPTGGGYGHGLLIVGRVR